MESTPFLFCELLPKPEPVHTDLPTVTKTSSGILILLRLMKVCLITASKRPDWMKWMLCWLLSVHRDALPVVKQYGNLGDLEEAAGDTLLRDDVGAVGEEGLCGSLVCHVKHSVANQSRIDLPSRTMLRIQIINVYDDDLAEIVELQNKFVGVLAQDIKFVGTLWVLQNDPTMGQVFSSFPFLGQWCFFTMSLDECGRDIYICLL
jgi:hypothetical protein